MMARLIKRVISLGKENDLEILSTGFLMDRKKNKFITFTLEKPDEAGSVQILLTRDEAGRLIDSFMETIQKHFK